MTFIVLILLLVLLIFGIPVGFALGLTGAVGLLMIGGWDSVAGILSTVPFRSVASFTLTAVPMFILMAEIISYSKVVECVFVAAQKWLQRLPGGLAIATIIASAGMGAMCGSSAASAATMAKVSVPELQRYGYKDEIATGVVAVSGTLAVMIPPSLTFIYYGTLTENSIGKLLISGIIPGIFTACMYVLGLLILKKLDPNSMPSPTVRYTMKERLDSLKPLWSFVILVVLVIGSIYSGVATATEAAALGAFCSFFIAVIMRRINLKGLMQCLYNTAKTTVMVFTIIIGAFIFGYFLTLTQIAQRLIAIVGEMEVSKWVVFAIVVVLYLVLGAFMETTAIIFITVPMIYPLMMSLGFDPIWFAVVLVKLMEIGMCTPPLGMNCYVVSGTTGVPLEKVFKGSAYMLAVDCISLLILVLFPVLSTWLPSVMVG